MWSFQEDIYRSRSDIGSEIIDNQINVNGCTDCKSVLVYASAINPKNVMIVKTGTAIYSANLVECSDGGYTSVDLIADNNPAGLDITVNTLFRFGIDSATGGGTISTTLDFTIRNASLVTLDSISLTRIHNDPQQIC